MKLGKLPAKRSLKTLPLSNYLNTSKVSFPRVMAWERPIGYGMLGNDEIGNCVVEGTKVSSPSPVISGYRSPYNGPVVKFTLASGKSLTVTPNHAVLTPCGFTLAHLIKKGDDLISTRGTEILPTAVAHSGQLNFNETPTMIEDVVAALALSYGAIREIVPLPVHFHGDGKFVDGNIQIVGADSFLGSELYASLGEPYTEDQVGAARQLKRCRHRAGTPLLRIKRSPPAAFGDIGGSSERASFGQAHPRISQTNGLQQGARSIASRANSFFQSSARNSKLSSHALHRLASYIALNCFTEVASPKLIGQRTLGTFSSTLNADLREPSLDGATTDAELVPKLFRRYAGLIERDHVLNVEVLAYSGHVYDLSTESRWYVANGSITHNCTCAAVAHMIQNWQAVANAGTPLAFTKEQVVGMYSAISGYDPATGANDNGCYELDVLNYWTKTGLEGHKISGYASIDLHNVDMVKAAVYVFGGVYMGFSVPNYIMDGRLTWEPQPGGTIDGGHAVPIFGYGRAGCAACSWGNIYRMNWSFWLEYVDEAYAVVSDDWLKHSGVSPSGLDLKGLLEDLQTMKH